MHLEHKEAEISALTGQAWMFVGLGKVEIQPQLQGWNLSEVTHAHYLLDATTDYRDLMRSLNRSMLLRVNVVHCSQLRSFFVKGHLPCSASTACTHQNCIVAELVVHCTHWQDCIHS